MEQSTHVVLDDAPMALLYLPAAQTPAQDASPDPVAKVPVPHDMHAVDAAVDAY